jgi:hypothetical protein
MRGAGENPISVSESSYARKYCAHLSGRAAAELRPFDAEAFKSKLIDYATIEQEESQEEG